MAQGALVVSSDTRGGRAYLRHGENAWVLPVGRIDGTIARVIEAIENPAATIPMRRAAIATAAAYGRDIFENRWAAVLKQVLDDTWRQPSLAA